VNKFVEMVKDMSINVMMEIQLMEMDAVINVKLKMDILVVEEQQLPEVHA
jgi:hypothetical protein